ncbi:Translation factor SUA5 [Chitinispirillum alkaliphilum]|nr:Translation factor SUA5 [Chitinispirillum alkaliphilum]
MNGRSSLVTFDIHPKNPQKRFLEAAAKILKEKNGIAVYPTDTVYGLGTCISNPKAVDKIVTLIQKDKSRLFSFICSDFSQISNYVRLSNNHYRLMKRYLPGPYTFILNATNIVPKKITPKRRTVGVRIPDCNVTTELVKLLGEPLANTSLNLQGELRGDPYEVRNVIANNVDVMLDAGPLENPVASTVVDLTDDEPVVIRHGKGEWRE